MGFGWFRSEAQLPCSEAERCGVDAAFGRLSAVLGRERLLSCEVVLPDDRFFPDRYDGSRASVAAMARRMGRYAGLREDSVLVEVYGEGEDGWRERLPVRREGRDAAGVYLHGREDGRSVIGVHASQVRNPVLLASTLAHELMHALLLGEGLLDRDVPEMEALTEIATIAVGLGVMRANGVAIFQQWSDGTGYGWRAQFSGYLSEAAWGYGLARFAAERGETRPVWAEALRGNVAVYFREAARFLGRR